MITKPLYNTDNEIMFTKPSITALNDLNDDDYLSYISDNINHKQLIADLKDDVYISPSFIDFGSIYQFTKKTMNVYIINNNKHEMLTIKSIYLHDEH